MKLLLLLSLLCVLCGPVRGQHLPGGNVSPGSVRVDRVPAEGLVLDQGWKFHPGDNPAWAAAAWDDRTWRSLDPTQPARAVSPQARAGIGWFRLHFQLDASLRHQPLLLSAAYTGAAELYLNGRLVQRAGTLAARPADVQPRRETSEPVELPADGPAEQVLAIRLAPWQAPALVRSLGDAPLLAVRVAGAHSFWEQQATRALLDSLYLVLGGVFLLLAFLHWAFFRYNPRQRANLYFAGYALALAGYAVGQYPFSFLRVDRALAVYALANALIYLSTLWAVRALYALFAVPPGRLYASLWACAGLLLPLSICLVPAYTMDYCYTTFLVLATADQLRLTYRARRQRGAGIISAGFAVGLLALMGYFLLLALHVPVSALAWYLSTPLIYLPPGVGISWYLAREFALDSQLLVLQLREVARLSAHTLAQEQEKQALLSQQNEVLDQLVHQRTAALEHALAHQRATQGQLVQAEKLASLGKLTAGIAHEMQNPLNFVTNFSEVSAELLDELAEQHARPARDAALESGLVRELQQNLCKIHQHGQRAAAIVRGMLDHAHPRTGERTRTDLNALADEHLRLAYQGWQTKHPSFQVALVTDFSPGLPRVDAVAADLGRVVVNLLTNAFYAVHQRQHAAGPDYQPTVSVSTRQEGESVELRVRDNGTGMSPQVQANLFQPFFTTKPTGEGTGLGLSLSYDIVTQGHGGTLTVESRQGEGSTFTVSFPLEGPS